MQDAVEHHDLRPGQHGAGEQNAHDMRGRQNLPGGADVRFQPLRQRIDVLFQLGEPQRPAHVAVRDVRSPEHDVVFDGAFKQRQMRIDHEAAATVDGGHVDMAQIHAVVADHASGRGLETR